MIVMVCCGKKIGNETTYIVVLQEGAPLPGPETGLLSNTRK